MMNKSDLKNCNDRKNKKLEALFMLMVFSHQVFAESPAPPINSASITASTLKVFPKCVHFRIRGTCFWQYEGAVNTTTYVEHYLPDVVVMVFNKPRDNPWSEINISLDKAGQMAEQKIVSVSTGFDAGSGQHTFSSRDEQNVFFKEADVIGNPALSVLSNTGFELLPSTANSLQPYYQSMLDSAMWRGLPNFPPARLEETYAIGADIFHHVGTGITDWGGIYPHEGKVNSSNDAKASAVIAQRAGDLVTSYLTAGHIFVPLSNYCGQECKASPVQENSDKTLYQMIYPVVDDGCDYFGDNSISYGDNLENKGNGAYAWVIWRFYSGCKQGIGTFMYKIIV